MCYNHGRPAKSSDQMNALFTAGSSAQENEDGLDDIYDIV